MSQSWISESEASERAGVSVNSLQRFAGAGYLQTKEDQGKTFFVKEDIDRIFGLSVPSVCAVSSSETRTETAARKSGSLKTRIELLKTTAGSIKNPAQGNIEALPQGVPQILRTDPLFPKENGKNRLARLKRQAVKLKRTAKLQKASLQIKEARLKDLKERRDWLKAQVEKLEDKGDRDQLLLLSETQAISRLLTPKQIKSPVRLALEWIGFSSSSNEGKDSTIEL